MAVKKFGVSIPEHIMNSVELRGDAGEGGRSQALSKCLSRYLDIINRSKSEMAKRFNRQECGLILDSCNGAMLSDSISVQLLPLGIADSIELEQLDEKWGVDGKGLLAKLNALSYAERMAMADGIQLWWNRVGQGENQIDYSQLLTIPKNDKDILVVY